MSETVRRRPPIWPLALALLTVLVDQVSKYFVVRYLDPGEALYLLGYALRLEHVRNTGVSFGQLQSYPAVITILGLVTVAFLFVGYPYLLTPAPWANAALGLVIGGAVGNLIDRVATAWQYGLDRAYVVDFIGVSIWPVFNVADSALTVGAIVYGLYLLLRGTRKGKPWLKGPPSAE
ncbi:MAG: signal peptidase II [Chloroflexia bacterium]